MTLTPAGYRPRLIDPYIERMLGVFGAVNIEGPKWCGKTWTAENHANSKFELAGSTGPMSNRDLALMDLHRVLQGEIPHLIDEWQEVPPLWDTVRSEVDKVQAKGRFLLTGSSVPKREEYLHSGAGRIGTVRMHTMTLYETGDSDGRVSLNGLFDGGLEMVACPEVTLEGLVDLTVRGGWPGALGLKREDYGLISKSYFETVAEDACRLDGRVRNRDKMTMLLRSLARNESTMAGNSTVMSGMKKFDEGSIAIETYYDYTDCLERIHLIEDTPSFRPNVRSDMRIGKTPKRHLADVSLAVAALGLDRETLMNDLHTFGFIFEALCEHDLGLYAERLGWKLFHYRDGRDRETDAVIETADGRWGAFEIKLSLGQVDEAADNLLAIRALFEKEGKPPAVLCVICGLSTYAYRRPDGVFVVPITALGP